MSASLVGSEMCIRDRLWPTSTGPPARPPSCLLAPAVDKSASGLNAGRDRERCRMESSAHTHLGTTTESNWASLATPSQTGAVNPAATLADVP
eukprot:5093230-Alexandrium_andersonii.AAC.1